MRGSKAHWLVCGSQLLSGILTPAAVWGEEFYVSPGQVTVWPACLIPSVSNNVSAVRVDKIFCEIFDADDPTTNMANFQFTTVVPSYNTTVSQVGAGVLGGTFGLTFPVTAAFGVSTPLANASATGGGAITFNVDSQAAAGILPATVCTNSGGIFTPGRGFVGTSTLTSTIALPSSAFALVAPLVGVGSLAGTTGGNNFSAVNDAYTPSTTGQPFLSLSPSVEVGLTLYLASYDSGSSSWVVRDVINNPTDYVVDYLDMVVDVYNVPSGGLGCGFTSRKWKLNLPRPVYLGVGEGLFVAFSASTNNSTTLLVTPFIRSLVTRLD